MYHDDVGRGAIRIASQDEALQLRAARGLLGLSTEHVRGQDLLRPGEPYIAQCGGYIRLFLITCFV